MLRSNFTCSLAAIVATVALTGPTSTRAAVEDERKIEVGFLAGVGFADKELVTHDKKDRANATVGFRYGQRFSRTLGFSFDGTYVSEYASRLPHGDTSELAARLAFDWYFAHRGSARWFVSPGFGWAKYGPENASGFERGFASLAVGQKWSLGCAPQNVSWQLRADQTVVGSDGVGGEELTSYKAFLGWSWGLGKPEDQDTDGVGNCGDACPDTPSGATVDRKGCPLDSDGDAVFDGIDRCPDTPRGALVDAAGCPVDADDDGVFDGIDRCPATPQGADADATGCPVDSDGDGVFDGVDRCPATPQGAPTGADGCPLDSDGDGAIDLSDTCPNTPRGALVDASGCPKDADGDAVPDGIDRCPDSARDCAVDPSGCPLDADADGACDALDRCPDTRAGVKVDATGCPLPEPPPKPAPLFPPGKRSVVLEGVQFGEDSANLTLDSFAVLDRVVASLLEWSDVKVEIGAFTDSRGSDASNYELTERRAKAVRNYFIQHGVEPSRLTAQGNGETRPIADNATEAGRARNRRIELRRRE